MRVTRSTRSCFRVTLQHGGSAKQLLFLRGRNGERLRLIRQFAPRGIAYLARGTLIPGILIPPKAIRALQPCLYAVEVLRLGKLPRIVRQGYSGKLFAWRDQHRTFEIFRKHDFTARRLRQVRAELDRLQLTSMEGGGR